MKDEKGEGRTHVNVQRPEVPAKLELLLDTAVLKVLVAKYDNTPLGDEEGEFIFLDVAELRELDTADLGADDGRERRRLDGGVGERKEVRLGLVGDETAVVELERLDGRELGLFVVDREVGGVFVLWGRVSFVARKEEEEEGGLPLRGSPCRRRA